MRLGPIRVFALLLALSACASEPERSEGHRARMRRVAADVDDARLRAAGTDGGHWLTHGRTYDEQRYSPLAQIDAGNVHELGLRWSFETGTRRGLEATPIVVDGVLYTTGTWSVVYAIDARTGGLIWRFDPRVPRRYGAIACCDVVNRGVALYAGRVYVGTLDGRLVALDSATGELVWEVVTVDRSRAYTITGAPRVVEGKVIIGNGGADLGVRGYVSAYDAGTGALVWRTYTVPGDPSQPFESEALERAARTWSGEWWKAGGGGTAWDSFAYDPELRLLYVGTGNGSPWNRHHRSPEGGDNLYLASILALRPDTGRLVWHFQTTPGESWDFTATQHMILADLRIGGHERKVILQAPKNGFFYVLDRETGEFLSAEPYVEVTWATGVDPRTGRPIEAEDLDDREQIVVVAPSSLGGHNWQPMSFNPETGLVYVPVQEMTGAHAADPDWRHRPGFWNTGMDWGVYQYLPAPPATGALLAWDPVRQREAWRVPYAHLWNGGTLTTAGNLVFQGTADGRFVAYRANDGEKLWEAPAGSGVIAAPVTYLVDGVQFVSVMAGWGGIFPLLAGERAAASGVRSIGRVLTFALGGDAAPLEAIPAAPPPPTPDPEALTRPEDVQQGGVLYHRWCMVCHGQQAVGGGVLVDLRHASPDVPGHFSRIARSGRHLARGGPSFADHLTEEDMEMIQTYVLSRALVAAHGDVTSP